MIFGQATEAVTEAASHMTHTWSGAVLAIVLLTLISMAWWFIIRLWGKGGIIIKRAADEEANKQRQLDILEKLSDSQRVLADGQTSQNVTCSTHVERLDKLVDVSEKSLRKQCEMVDVVKGTAKWHDDPRNPRNVLSVHQSVRDLANAGELFVQSRELPQDIHDKLVAIFERIRARAEILDGEV